MFSHQCYGWNPLMSHLTFHGGDGSMGHHGILDLLTAPCGACCDAGLFFHWATCNRDGSHLGWIDLLWLFWFTVCWCLLPGMFMDIFFRKQGKNTCFTVSQLLVALLYVQLHTTRQHCSKTHHSSDPKGWSGHMERVSYVQEVWSGPVEKVLNLHKLIRYLKWLSISCTL